jgi:OOP family OmpA-OmpF porin
MSTLLRAAVAAAALIPLSAGAWDNGGWHFGAGVGRTEVDILGLDESATGWKAFGGYRFTRNFGVEVGYLDTGTAKHDFGAWEGRASGDAISASVVGILPFAERWAAIARVGMLSWDVRATGTDEGGSTTLTDSGEDLYWGVGLYLNVEKNAGFRLEYEMADIDGADLRMATLSLVFHF